MSWPQRLSQWRIVLASRSPARSQLLANAGAAAEIHPSGVDEDSLIAGFGPQTVGETAAALASAKASAVLNALRTGPKAVTGPTLIVGADSILDFRGKTLGKPPDVETARRRWLEQSGAEATLVTGHHVIATSANRKETLNFVVSSRLRLGVPTAGELEAYLATGEPLEVAGGLTIDGLGSVFVEEVQGDPNNIIGLALPTLRRELHGLGIEWDYTRPRST